MVNRITIAMLEFKVDYLNKITNSPPTPWTRRNGVMLANIGNHHLSQQYGGVCVHRMATKGGGVTCPLDHGHAPKRETWEKLNAYIAGIESVQGQST